MNCGALDETIARFAMGLASVEDLSGAAAKALSDGCDAPSLWTLAGLREGDLDEAIVLFERALVELRKSVPETRQAMLSLARDAAERILRGELSPYQGAARSKFGS